MTDPTAAPPIPQTRVLVVDDETHVRSALTRSLTLLGYSADGAASGHQALGMLECAPYDAMVLDLHMPGISGVEVMQGARQMCPGLIIVILTGRATLMSVIAAVKSHAASYLFKPVSVHDIAAVIADSLQRRTHSRAGSTRSR